MCAESHIFGNLFLGMQFRTCKNFWTSTDFHLVESPNFSTNTKATPPLLRLFFVLICHSEPKAKNLKRNIFRFCDSQNLWKNNPRVSARLESRPLRGAKNRNQGCSSATADFLLEAEKRGSPPKSEKRQLLGTHLNNSRGEREQGGAALLREETRELNSQKSDDFANNATIKIL